MSGMSTVSPLAGRLAHMPAREKLDRLGEVVHGRKHALVLTHDNPDPDSIAAAVALADLLERHEGVEAKVGYGGIIGRAENLAFVKVLKLPGTTRSRPATGRTSWWTTTRCARRRWRCRSRTWEGTSAPRPRCWWST
jgi:hypothetical protein